MELKHAIIRPATVVSVMENNVIKVSAPGLFSKYEDKELLPPVYPFIETSKNSYTNIKVGDIVWLLNVTNNPSELFWLRKPDYEFGMEDKSGGSDVEILMRREYGASWAEIYFSDSTGWVVKNDGSSFKIDADGNIQLSTGGSHQTIEINSEGISLGTAGKSAHPVALGDKVEDTLNFISLMLEQIGEAASASPYTYAISTVINTMQPILDNKIETIKSNYVTVD